MESDISYDIAAYLQGKGFGTLGTDIFCHEIPAATAGVMVERLGGTLNDYVPIEETVIDIYVKHQMAASAISKIERIKRVIHRDNHISTTNSYIFTLRVIGDVEDLERDAENYKIYKLTLLATHRSKGVIS